MRDNILVTSYENPDLDGTACAISYAEFLTKKGKNVLAAVFGSLHKETQFVLKTFGINPPENGEKVLTVDSQVILVDASDTVGISQKISPLKVIEIIDHRKITRTDRFPHAKVQIELVGSAATLIAEKFYSQKVPISVSSAALLYSAIISNTVNFKADVTTPRDTKMALFLENHFTKPEEYVHAMFTDKSRFDKPLKEVFDHDFAPFMFAGKSVGIAQLEITRVDTFVSERIKEIQTVLREIQREKKLDYIFLTAIDVERATNTFVVIDQKTKVLLRAILQIPFTGFIGQKEGVIMRKSLTPRVKNFLEGKGGHG